MNVCDSGTRVFAVSDRVAVVVLVGKTTTAAHCVLFRTTRNASAKECETGRPRWGGQGEKSENIRLNQMQIERFAVGNFQFSSPVGARESSRSLLFLFFRCAAGVGIVVVPRIGYRKNKPGIDFLSPRFVSIRYDSIRSGLVLGSRCEFTGKSGWLLPGMCLLLAVCFLLVGFTGSFVRLSVRVYVLLIIFCPDGRCFDNYAIVAASTEYSLRH